jgi:chloramphenicol O-acetyltransferase type A
MGYEVLREYGRRPHLELYRRYPSPFYSTTFELDATEVKAAAKRLAASTYASLVWSFHRALLGIDAFRTRLLGEDVVLHDGLRIGLTVPAPEGRFTFADLDWHADAEAFLIAARERIASASAGVDLEAGAAPDFAYYTALPRVPFTAFTHAPLADPTAGQPETAFGKMREKDGRLLVPVSVQVNHLYVDGADLGALYEAARESFATAF